ncbi:MAG: FAD-binding protein [Candidatus Micrarchaeaceae archaeon]
MESIKCDVLIVGSGAAGLNAALHAYDYNQKLKIILVTKGLVGKCGCSRMVQGGLNVVLNPEDSINLHFQDTLKGGQFINNQELAWTLVSDAPKRVLELELNYGVFWDRAKDGRIHQKPFAGQSFDRTVHRKDLTGIEIVSRMTDQIFARNISVIEETRIVALLLNNNGDKIGGALLLNIRTGEPMTVNAKAVVVATGGSASMYRISAPSFDKTGDGMSICYKVGLEFVDMEMLQFHPTGILAGKSKMTGSLLEEGLRGAGGRLYNYLGERYMERYDPERLERSTRDVVSRASYMEIMAGRGTPNNGVYIDMTHLGADFVEKQFPGMCNRVRDIGKSLAKEKIEISPSAHYQMGGVCINKDCCTSLSGLFVAGEDAGGVHGANRLGGNGICDSVVFGARAGESVAQYASNEVLEPFSQSHLEEAVEELYKPFENKHAADIYAIRDEMKDLMWEKVGIVRTGEKLQQAIKRLDELQEEVELIKLHNNAKEYNLEWNEILNVKNWLVVAKLVATSALYRTESRGAHYRSDFPKKDNENWMLNIFLKKEEGKGLKLYTKPVAFSRLRPEEINFK